MAVIFSSKPPAATTIYTWSPFLAPGDAVSSYTLTPNTVTIEASTLSGDEIQMYIAGGLAGNVYAIEAAIETSLGESIKETLYLPIDGPGNSFSDTAQTVVNFALKPIVGLSGTPTAAESADALEWLNGLLASWKGQGADVGVALPLTLSSVIYASDQHLLAIKNNLRVFAAEQYGRQVAPATAALAARGLQLIKTQLLPDDRGTAEYY